MVRLIQRIPFLPAIAVIFGWAAGTVILAMPVWQLDTLLADFGVYRLPDILRPPLSPLGRFLCAASMGMAVSLIWLMPAVMFRGWRAARRTPVIVPHWPGAPRHDNHPPAPASPLSSEKWPEFLGDQPRFGGAAEADEFLLEAAMRVSEAPRTDAAPKAATSVADCPAPARASPVRLHQPDPVLIMEPAPVQPPASHCRAASPVPDTSDISIAELLDRIEHCVSHWRPQATQRPLPPSGLGARASAVG